LPVAYTGLACAIAVALCAVVRMVFWLGGARPLAAGKCPLLPRPAEPPPIDKLVERFERLRAEE
jgi:hypothetical protein